MNNTNKQFVVRQLKGIEEIVIIKQVVDMMLRFLQLLLLMVMENLQNLEQQLALLDPLSRLILLTLDLGILRIQELS